MSDRPRKLDAMTSAQRAAGQDEMRVRGSPLKRRLPRMSNESLMKLQQAAARFAKDAEHPKHTRATFALPTIDAEIARRADGLARGEAGLSLEQAGSDD